MLIDPCRNAPVEDVEIESDGPEDSGPIHVDERLLEALLIFHASSADGRSPGGADGSAGYQARFVGDPKPQRTI